MEIEAKNNSSSLEVGIRTMKEWARDIYHSLPYPLPKVEMPPAHSFTATSASGTWLPGRLTASTPILDTRDLQRVCRAGSDGRVRITVK